MDVPKQQRMVGSLNLHFDILTQKLVLRSLLSACTNLKNLTSTPNSNIVHESDIALIPLLERRTRQYCRLAWALDHGSWLFCNCPIKNGHLAHQIWLSPEIVDIGRTVRAKCCCSLRSGWPWQFYVSTFCRMTNFEATQRMAVSTLKPPKICQKDYSDYWKRFWWWGSIQEGDRTPPPCSLTYRTDYKWIHLLSRLS